MAEPTPRQERLDHDYSNEFPKVEVESRRITSAGVERSTTKSTNKNFDSIKLHDEVLDKVGCFLTFNAALFFMQFLWYFDTVGGLQTEHLACKCSNL